MAFTNRSEKTRADILVAARRLLARRGYEGATIRAVAAEAGIDPSMVMRYYGNKEGLFAAAVDIDLQLPSAADHPRERLGEVLAAHLVSRWEGALSDEVILLLLRSAGTTPAAAEQFREVFARQIVGFVRDAVGDGPETRRRAAMVSSQVLGVALCRYVLNLPPLVAIDGDGLAAILAPVLQHYLVGNLGGPVPQVDPRPVFVSPPPA